MRLQLGKTLWFGAGLITVVMALGCTGRADAAGCSHPWLNDGLKSQVLGFTSLEQAGALPAAPAQDLPAAPKPCQGTFCSGGSPLLPIPAPVNRPDRWTDSVVPVQTGAESQVPVAFWDVADAVVKVRKGSGGIFHPPR